MMELGPPGLDGETLGSRAWDFRFRSPGRFQNSGRRAGAKRDGEDSADCCLGGSGARRPEEAKAAPR